MTSKINTKEIAAKARDAKAIMACLSESEKNRVLDGFKTNLLLNKTKILEANQIDLLNAKKKELSQAFIDRLKLNAERVQAMADSIIEIMNLPEGEKKQKLADPSVRKSLISALLFSIA